MLEVCTLTRDQTKTLLYQDNALTNWATPGQGTAYALGTLFKLICFKMKLGFQLAGESISSKQPRTQNESQEILSIWRPGETRRKEARFFLCYNRADSLRFLSLVNTPTAVPNFPKALIEMAGITFLILSIYPLTKYLVFT